MKINSEHCLNQQIQWMVPWFRGISEDFHGFHLPFLCFVLDYHNGHNGSVSQQTHSISSYVYNWMLKCVLAGRCSGALFSPSTLPISSGFPVPTCPFLWGVPQLQSTDNRKFNCPDMAPSNAAIKKKISKYSLCQCSVFFQRLPKTIRNGEKERLWV